MDHTTLAGLSEREGLRQYYHEQIAELICQAEDQGIVITVSLKSDAQRPSTGGYKAVVESRHGRGQYLPEGVLIPPREPKPYRPVYTGDYGSWPQMSIDARRTGRTTRMMQHALVRAQAGKHTVIVAYSHEYATELRNRAWASPDGSSLWSARDPAISPFVRFVSAQDWRVDVSELRVRGLATEQVLWSHEALEQSMRQHLLELHRFDGKLPEWVK